MMPEKSSTAMEWPNKQVNQEELIGGCKVALTLSD
jgi:hypothetical protein